MALKMTWPFLLVYAAMAAHLAAGVALASGQSRLGRRAFVLGFSLALGALVLHTVQVGRPPLRNLFEVFLCLGTLAWPLSAASRRYLGVGGEAADALAGAVLLFPVGFVFSADLQPLPPILQHWLFAPHVAAYVLAYVIMLKAGVQGFQGMVAGPDAAGTQTVPYADGAFRMVRLGFPLLTLGLILGSVWGKQAWADYWHWDPKELWGLAMWLVYVLYFQVRAVTGRGARRIQCSLVVLGAAVVVVTVLWVNLSRVFAGLHSYAV